MQETAGASPDMLRFQELEQKRKMLEDDAAEFTAVLESVGRNSLILLAAT